MKVIVTVALAISIMFAGPALAQSANEVKPGNAPTEAMTDATPDMTGECVKNIDVNTKAPGTEATEATGELVPTMKPDKNGKCPEGTTLKPESMPNNE